jgi:hypothetical protein
MRTARGGGATAGDLVDGCAGSRSHQPFVTFPPPIPLRPASERDGIPARPPPRKAAGRSPVAQAPPASSPASLSFGLRRERPSALRKTATTSSIGTT